MNRRSRWLHRPLTLILEPPALKPARSACVVATVIRSDLRATMSSLIRSIARGTYRLHLCRWRPVDELLQLFTRCDDFFANFFRVKGRPATVSHR